MRREMTILFSKSLLPDTFLLKIDDMSNVQSFLRPLKVLQMVSGWVRSAS